MSKYTATAAKAFEVDSNIEIYLTMNSGRNYTFRLMANHTDLFLMVGPHKASRDFAGELKAAREIAFRTRPEAK